MWLRKVTYLAILIPLLADFSAAIRLPNTSIPINYDLDLFVDVDQRLFNGSVKIQLDVVQVTSVLSLNYHEISCDNVTLIRTVDGKPYDVSITFRPSDQILDLYANESLGLGGYTLSVDFQGAIRNDLKGLYTSSYWLDGVKRYIATTFFAANFARMVFPLYDEPHLKATYDVRIGHPSRLRALSNSPVIRLDGNAATLTTVTTFSRTLTMSSYLLAFVVFDFVGLTNNNTTIWSQSSRIESTQYSLQNSALILRELETYLASPYQMTKLDLVAVDDFLMGAMENWGLLTFASGRVLRDNQTTSREDQNIFKIVAHELVHQWFGNLVTCAWWDEVWLNEGFATYLEDLVTDRVHPEWNVLSQFVVHEKKTAMTRDASRTNTRFMSQAVTTLAEISGIYDFVAYSKAASIIRMIHHAVGDVVFQESLRQYLRNHAYSTATGNDLFTVLQNKSIQYNIPGQPESLIDVFDHWASTPGYPVLNVNRDYGRGLINLTQERFKGSQFVSSIADQSYHIPVNYITEELAVADPIYWYMPTSPPASIPSTSAGWMLFNLNAFGYYRVNYDIVNWNMLIAALKSDNHRNISAVNRAQLIDDSFALARYNYLPYDVALDLVQYSTAETEYVPLYAALTNVKELERNLRGIDVDENALLSDLIKGLYKGDQLTAAEPTAQLDILSNVEVVHFACRFGYQRCIENAHVKFAQFQTTGIIAPNLRSTILCGSVQSDGRSDKFPDVLDVWKLLAKTEYDRSENDRIVSNLMGAFACLRNAAHQRELLDLSINPSPGFFISGADRNRLLDAVASSNYEGTEIALRFMLDNYAAVTQHYNSIGGVYDSLGPNVVDQTLTALFNQLVMRDTRETVRSLFPRTYAAAMNAVRQVEENMQFRLNHQDLIKRWFNDNYSGSKAKLIINSVLVGVCALILRLL